jgi:hypothetical protein
MPYSLRRRSSKAKKAALQTGPLFLMGNSRD